MQVGDRDDWAVVSTGSDQTQSCGVRSDGTLWCWSGPDQMVQIGEAGVWRMVSSARYHSCAVQIDGTLWCWGSNSDGQLGDGTDEDRAEPSRIGSRSNWLSVSVGNRAIDFGMGGHSCGVRRDGTLWCWGKNDYGDIWNDGTRERSSPTQVGDDKDWATVAAGGREVCATRQDRSLWCWGDLPTQVGTETDWVELAMGDDHSCAIRSDGSLWCWGTNYDAYMGKLGDGTGIERDAPTRVGSEADWIAIAVGWRHTCAGRGDGSLWCWGSNKYGQIGDGTQGWVTETLSRSDERTDWSQISAHAFTTCATRVDGTLWCWGDNAYDELPGSVHRAEALPVQVGEESDWRDVVVGGMKVCGTKVDESLWCWGAGADSLVAFDADWGTPNPVEAGTAWVEVDAGKRSTCAISADQTLSCWDDSGPDSPANDADQWQWTTVAIGGGHTCAIRLDSTLWCWGNNGSGQLGDGTTDPCINTASCSSDFMFNQVGTDSDWVTVVAGDRHTCGIRADASLWCWGEDVDGQLGVGTSRSNPTLPVQIEIAEEWTTLAAGYGQTCALRRDGSLWCWGAIGEGGFASRTPVQIGEASDFADIAAGQRHVCALRQDGSRWCFGSSDSGQLGDGDAWKLLPVQVLVP